MRKLSSAQIAEIQAHYTSDEVSFLLPDKKYGNKRFLHIQVSPNVLKCTACWLQQLGKSPQQHFPSTNLRQSSYKAIFLSGKVAAEMPKF